MLPSYDLLLRWCSRRNEYIFSRKPACSHCYDKSFVSLWQHIWKNKFLHFIHCVQKIMFNWNRSNLFCPLNCNINNIRWKFEQRKALFFPAKLILIMLGDIWWYGSFQKFLSCEFRLLKRTPICSTKKIEEAKDETTFRLGSPT